MTNQTETTKPEARAEAGGQVERVVRRIRKFAARRLAKLAMRLDPTSKEVIAFYQKQAFDMAVFGTAVVHVDYKKLSELPKY